MSGAARLGVVLYEGAGSRPFAPEARATALQRLLEQGYVVSLVRGGQGPGRAPAAGPLLVLGRFEEHPPAVGEDGSGSPVFFRDVQEGSAEAVLAAVEAIHAEAGTAPRARWKPWFPVIDFSRCTNCLQCLTFCLFDVYGVSRDKKIEVRNPTNCKTDCPACSRVCPEVAILFPKYKAGPINGDEVREADLHREKMKVDISALLGGDIYAALRQRSTEAKARFSRERDEKRALDERRKCLTKLQQDLGIPPEVIAALPSLEQIQARAARALAETEDQPS